MVVKTIYKYTYKYNKFKERTFQGILKLQSVVKEIKFKGKCTQGCCSWMIFSIFYFP